jgi:Domain of unknown function (DUF4145)
MTPKYVAPSISAHSFSCPHCGTLAHQTWFFLFATSFDKDDLPLVAVSPQDIVDIQSNREFNETKKAEMMQYIRRLSAGELFLASENDSHYSNTVRNLHLSQCYSCNKYALWLHDNLLYPAPHLHVECNSDMPDEIRADFNEAREIFFLSPRGAAALLRLAVQKLCAVLGESGKDINADIASLVTKGLSVQIQQALDIVRVIGNEAVHPGQIDLNDDPATAA